MKNPYNLCSSGESLELASDQRELHDILSQYRLDKDMERLNQEILNSLLAEQEKWIRASRLAGKSQIQPLLSVPTTAIRSFLPKCRLHRTAHPMTTLRKLNLQVSTSSLGRYDVLQCNYYGTCGCGMVSSWFVDSNIHCDKKYSLWRQIVAFGSSSHHGAARPNSVLFGNYTQLL